MRISTLLIVSLLRMIRSVAIFISDFYQIANSTN
jgi:hypothetical protein